MLQQAYLLPLRRACLLQQNLNLRVFKKWILGFYKKVACTTSKDFVFSIRYSSFAQDSPVLSLYFTTSEVKACTWATWRSRSSLTCCNSPRRHFTSFANVSFWFKASSWAVYKNTKCHSNLNNKNTCKLLNWWQLKETYPG